MNILKALKYFLLISILCLGGVLELNAGIMRKIISMDTTCLKIKCLAISEGKALDGVNAKLYKENEEMEMMEITSVSHHSHNFFFNLMKDSYYTVEVSKPGYVTRIISVSTKLPRGVKTEPIFEYEIKLEMHKEKQIADDYYLDFPIALIDYDPVKDVFVSHGKYTAYIKGKIKETLEEIPETEPQKER